MVVRHGNKYTVRILVFIATFHVMCLALKNIKKLQNNATAIIMALFKKGAYHSSL